MNQTDTIERTAIVAYVLLQEVHRVLADPCKPDDVTLGHHFRRRHVLR